jgi:signal transduction histidine kinase
MTDGRTGVAERWRDDGTTGTSQSWRRYLSTISLPLMHEADIFGCLVIVGAQSNVFGSEEVGLLRDLAENVALGVSVIRERRRREKAEAMLRQSQKMEAIGTLAGGIAHDFNNILASILGFTQLILLDPKNPDEVVEFARNVQSSGNRAKELVRLILTFSRQQPSNKMPIDLCQTLNEVYQLVLAVAPSTIKITLVLPPGRAMILGTTSEVHQILMNFCANAVDAISSHHGTISIVLARRDGGFDLSVTDSGCGIPEEIRPNIFDPFFTTKSVGKGTALGLSVVHGIVENLGGTISVESPPEEALGWIEKGERFDIVITDQTMPEVTGIELSRTIADCAPGTKVLLCSGRDGTIDYDEIATAHIDGFILKPLDLTELADTMQRLLEGVEATA